MKRRASKRDAQLALLDALTVSWCVLAHDFGVSACSLCPSDGSACPLDSRQTALFLESVGVSSAEASRLSLGSPPAAIHQ